MADLSPNEIAWRAVEASAERAFLAIIASAERAGDALPALRRVAVDRYPIRRNQILFVAELAFAHGNRSRFNWSDRGDARYLPLDELRVWGCNTALTQWSRVVEDYLMQREIRHLDTLWLDAVRHSGPSNIDTLHTLRREIVDLIAHVRRHHCPPSYVRVPIGVGMDELRPLAAPPAYIDYYERSIAREIPPLSPEIQTALARTIRTITEMERALFRDLLVGGADDVGDDAARERGEKLLVDWLSPAQREQYQRDRAFEVRGSVGGRYRIRHGRQMNIDEIDDRGRRKHGWCFLPQGQLVAGDVMLAQKIALETDERAAIAVANRIP